MTLQEEVNIIYRYIVEGKSMEDAAACEGYNTSDASKMIREYGFNNDAGQRSGWQSGKDRGRYAQGKAAARGLTITKTMIREYLRDVKGWGWDFESFVADKAARSRPPQRTQQSYQPAGPSAWELERQRRAREEAERQRRLQEEQARRAREEAERKAREEQQRRLWEEQARRAREEAERKAREEAERRAREEQARRIREEAERKAREEQNKRRAAELLRQGREALQRGEINNAYKALNESHRLNPTWMGNLLLAETLARADNAGEFADDVIKLLTEHFKGYEQKKHTIEPTADQYLWRAQAYLNKGDKNRACDDYFRAGDVYYKKQDYANADRIYTQGREKTNYYSGVTPNAAFRVAFSRGKKGTLTQADHRICVTFYNKAIEKNQQKSYAYGNLSWHLSALNNYYEAIEAAEKAMEEGLHEAYVYNHLFNARLACGYWEEAEQTLNAMNGRGYSDGGKRKLLYDKWLKDKLLISTEEALRVINRLDEKGLPYERWIKGACLLDCSDRVSEGLGWLEQWLEDQPAHLDALYCMANCQDESDQARLRYAERYLAAYVQDSERYIYSEYHHRESVRYLVQDITERMDKAERERREAEEARRRREAEEAERLRRKKEEEEALLLLF